jgi:hypothetical protein
LLPSPQLLSEIIEEREIDIMSLTETNLNEDTPNENISIENYNIIRVDRDLNFSNKIKGGGVLLGIEGVPKKEDESITPLPIGRLQLSVHQTKWLLTGYKTAQQIQVQPHGPQGQTVKIFPSKWGYTHLFNNSDRDPHSENNNVSQIYT